MQELEKLVEHEENNEPLPSISGAGEDAAAEAARAAKAAAELLDAQEIADDSEEPLHSLRSRYLNKVEREG